MAISDLKVPDVLYRLLILSLSVCWLIPGLFSSSFVLKNQDCIYQVYTIRKSTIKSVLCFKPLYRTIKGYAKAKNDSLMLIKHFLKLTRILSIWKALLKGRGMGWVEATHLRLTNSRFCILCVRMNHFEVHLIVLLWEVDSKGTEDGNSNSIFAHHVVIYWSHFKV